MTTVLHQGHPGVGPFITYLVGPAPSHVMALGEGKRSELRDRLERRSAPGPEGAIDLIARAWAVRGTVP